ncbi:MAG: phosphotransferase family protein [Caulobacteraceae bacterium]|nr:phosphotransferase family protein [Caulobacteraceae bacterium]
MSSVAGKIAAGASGISGLRRLSGGASQELWRFDLTEGETRTPMILRRAPGGDRVSETAAGLEIEAALIQAADRIGVPVPPVRYVLSPKDGLGRGFVMGFVEGETLGGRIVKGEAFAEVRPRLARQCGEILARIHTLDPADFPTLKRSTPAELLAQWLGAYRATEWPRPVFELAFRWLERNCPPPPTQPRLVHGDFRNGNLMFGPGGVRAVLDWELAHVGDPMEDLGWICVNSWRFGMVHKPVGGFGDLGDLFAGYEAAGGPPVNRAAAKWWEVFGSMRWGVMCSGMSAAFRTVDPSVERAVIARRTSENELDLMRLLAD